MEKVYAAVLAAEQAAIAALVPGAHLRDAYAAALAALTSAAPELADKLGKNVGFAMHLELRETKLQLAPSNEAVAREGMVFNVTVGIAKLENEAAATSKDKCASDLHPTSARHQPSFVALIRQLAVTAVVGRSARTRRTSVRIIAFVNPPGRARPWHGASADRS